jgi:N-acetylmuramic acid 6-phosphate etherase
MEDPEAALALLLDVDRDVVDTYREWSRSGAAIRIGREIAARLGSGGRIFFTGCGATGRLSIQLVSIWREHCKRLGNADMEQRAVSVMAGGDFALIKSVEGFEDFRQFGARQIEELGVTEGDVVFSITEGGETSFVIGTAWKALEKGAKVFFVYNNPDEILCKTVTRSREVIEESRIEKINLTTGPMAITGSTRMQATSIQLCAMMTILEVAFAMESGDEYEGIPERFLAGLEEIHRTLGSESLRRQLAQLVAREEEIFRNHRRNNYFADRLAIDVLTDTTERSPTFCLPGFRKSGDHEAAESTSFIFLPSPDSEAAWRRLLKRELQAVEWDRETIRSLIGEAGLDRQDQVMKAICREEILRFRMGLDGLADRPFRPGDSACAVLIENELAGLTGEDGFFRRQLEAAHEAGSTCSLIFFGRTAAIGEVERFLAEWHVSVQRVFVPMPERRMPLLGAERVAVKMLFNALSTLTMVRVGRVLGNFMIRVVPGNLKLIDRAIRYVQHFAGLCYEDACHLVHRAIEHIAPRMKAGKEYPSVVGLCLIVARDGCSFEEAEGARPES